MKKAVTVLLLLLSTIAYSSDQTLPKVSEPVSRSDVDESVKIKLVLGDKAYDLKSYTISYYRTDKAKTKGSNALSFTYPYLKNSIGITLISSSIDQELLNWILAPEQQAKDGQIIVTDIETNKTLKTILFTDANTYTFSESNNTNSHVNIVQFSSFSLDFSSISIRY